MKKIALFVTSAHLLMIFFLLFSPVKKNPHPTKHIAVRTIQHRPKIQMGTSAVAQGSASPARSSPRPPSSHPSASTRASSLKPVAAKPNSSTKEPTKTTGALTPSPSNGTSTKKPSSNKKPAVVEKNKKEKPKPKAVPPPEVFKEIDEALAKIDEKGYSSSRLKLDVPQIQDSSAIALPFPFDSGSSEPMGPEETLVSYLHSSLNLPEFGEVKIQVTVNKEGSIEKLVVLHAESKKNKAYLEQHLPLLELPITLEKEKTFTLTFCNEI